MYVRVFNNDVNTALRKLKRKMFNEGIIKELMERRFYEKPSEKRRRKKIENTRRLRREQVKYFEELGVDKK